MTKVQAREGDVLVVAYPEVTVPIAQFSGVKVGGLIYTRKLIEGDDVEEQYRAIYDFLKAKATADGRIKIQEYRDELNRLRGAP